MNIRSFAAAFRAVLSTCLASVLLVAGVARSADGPPSTPLDNVVRIDIPSVNGDALKIEDEQRAADGLPPRFAVPYEVHVKPETMGTCEQLEGGVRQCRLRVTSAGALSINFGFGRYHMPAGGRLTIYSADGRSIVRPFTEADNSAHGQLWTPVVLGDDAVIELTINEDVLPQLEIELTAINIGYRGFGELAGKSGACNVDVACPQADPWRDQVHAVGVISTGGSTFCTGSMVNNTAQDLKPYFTTANHCGINSGNAASLVVYWNYENSTCRPVGSAASGGAGNGVLTDFQSGAFFRASYGPSDFTLVEMDSPPDPSWNVVFAGWNHGSGESPSGAAIHHPNTDEKRITFYSIPTTTTSYNNPSVPGDGTHVHATWSLGVTEPGSSGSPLYDVNHRYIGQLHGGPSACGASDLSDYYGRFSISWTGGGTNTTRASNWLDPGNTGAIVLDFISGGGLSISPSDAVSHIGPVGGPFSNPSVAYTLTNPTADPLDYQVSLTANFGLLIDGDTIPVTGTLAASGGTAQVTVSVGPATSSLSAGTYVETVVFDDLTHALQRTRQHTVEVGQTLFSVTPANGLASGGAVGGPFSGTQVYTVTSDRPTPVSVKITASDQWISLNGGAGPVTLNLNGTGDSGTVTVGFSSAADSLSAGIYNGSVSFENQTSGTGGNTTRSVALDVGRIVHTSTDTPQPIGDNSSLTSVITFPEDFCIGDVNVEINITHTYIGDLSVDLTSPSGITVRLHNRTGAGAHNIVLTYDDEGTSPDGPGALSDFDFSSSAGPWTLTVADNATQDIGTLNSWALRIAPSAGACPTPEQIYSFPLDTNPGWTTQGQWAYGHPTGGGSHNHDPSNGYTGSNCYGYNLAGDYANALSTVQYLTTSAIDCSGISYTRLIFRRWLGVESATYDHANIQVSTNGTTWTTAWQHTATSAISDAAWMVQSVDISSVADGQSTVYIRWGMGPTDGSVTYPGWNIDDVTIWGIPLVVTCSESVASNVCCKPSAPAAESSPREKNRYVTVLPGTPGRNTALRVKLISLQHPDPSNLAQYPAPNFAAFEGQVRWVGPPSQHVEAEGPPQTTFTAAALQCDPFYMDWSTVGAVQLTGIEIVPDSAYEIQVVAEACGAASEGNYSTALAAVTNRWGDITAPYQAPSPNPLTQPNISDVAIVIDKFKGLPTAPIVAAGDLNPGMPDFAVNISDIAISVDGFKGFAYPFSGPTACP